MGCKVAKVATPPPLDVHSSLRNEVSPLEAATSPAPGPAREIGTSPPIPTRRAESSLTVRSIAARAGCSEEAVRLALEEFPDRLKVGDQGQILFLRGEASQASPATQQIALGLDMEMTL